MSAPRLDRKVSVTMPVVGRIAEGAFLPDMRCMEEDRVGEFSGQMEQLKL
jgi:hypothetical protein